MANNLENPKKYWLRVLFKKVRTLVQRLKLKLMPCSWHQKLNSPILQSSNSRIYSTAKCLKEKEMLKFWPNCEVNGLYWQCCLAGSSKRAPRILIFSIAMGTEYLSHVKFIATRAPTFFGYIILVLASVR